MSFLRDIGLGAAATGLIAAFGIPVLAPLGLIVAVVTHAVVNSPRTGGHDNENQEDPDADGDGMPLPRYPDLNRLHTPFDYQRYLQEYPVAFRLRPLNDGFAHMIPQQPMIMQDYVPQGFMAREEDDGNREQFDFTNTPHGERRVRADNGREPNLRNEDYFRRHPERA